MQRLGERHELARRARSAHAAAGDNHRPRRVLQNLHGRQHARLIRLRPERRHARKLRLDHRLHLAFVTVDLTFIAAELQMHRTRPPGGRGAKRLPNHVRKAGDIIDRGVPLGHRLECRHVVDLLIDLPELGLRLAAAGERDHRRMGEPGVAQAGGEIERADHLRHADAGLAGGAGVAVGHIGRRRLAVHMQPLDLGARLHHREGLPQDRRDVKHMRHAVGLEHVGHAFRAEHFPVVSESGHDVQSIPVCERAEWHAAHARQRPGARAHPSAAPAGFQPVRKPPNIRELWKVSESVHD